MLQNEDATFIEETNSSNESLDHYECMMGQSSRRHSDATADASARPPVRTRSSRSSRIAMKEIQRSSLDQMQRSLNSDGVSQDQNKMTTEMHRNIQRSHSSPMTTFHPDQRNVEKSISGIVERVAQTKSLLPRQDHHLHNQPRTPVRSRSPLSSSLDIENSRPPRSPTRPNSEDGSVSSPCDKKTCGRPPRRSSLSPRSTAKSTFTISQISERHRARRRNSLSSSTSSEESLLCDRRTRGGMLPATRPQRRASNPASQECDVKAAPTKIIGMDGQVVSTVGSNGRNRNNGTKERRHRRHSIGTTTIVERDVTSIQLSPGTKPHTENNISPKVTKSRSSDSLDRESFHVSPPKPKASRALSASLEYIKKDTDDKDYVLIPESPPLNTQDELSKMDRSPRQRRFSLPRITRSISLSIRSTTVEASTTIDDKKRSRSRSPSITSLFSKSGDLSSRSSTERTASTVSSEHSNSSWEESPCIKSPPVKPNDGGAFGKIMSRLKSELQQTSPLVSPIPNQKAKTSVVRSGRRPTYDEYPCEEKAFVTRKRGSNTEGCGPGEQYAGKVCFGTVSIREYARTVSNNPSVGAGTPIGLDWAYSDPTTVSVDYFEKNFRKAGRRRRQDLHLTPEQRFHMLLDDWNVSLEEIKAAKKSAAKDKYLRQMSLSGTLSTVEALNKLLPFDRKAPSRERTSLQNFRLPRGRTSRLGSPAKTGLHA